MPYNITHSGGDAPPMASKGGEKVVVAPKRFLKSGLIFLAVAAVILGTIAYLNYRLDPLTFSSSEQAKAAAALESGRNIAIPHSNIDWRQRIHSAEQSRGAAQM